MAEPPRRTVFKRKEKPLATSSSSSSSSPSSTPVDAAGEGGSSGDTTSPSAPSVSSSSSSSASRPTPPAARVPGPHNAFPLGTKPSVHNGQLLVSSGLADFDKLAGGGYPLGSVILVTEDTHSQYCHTLLKYFLAEGVSCGHTSVFVTADSRAAAFELPFNLTVSEVELEASSSSSSSSSSASSSASAAAAAELKIAWQYGKYIESELEKDRQRRSMHVRSAEHKMRTGSVLCHHFDLSRPMQSDVRAANPPRLWDVFEDAALAEASRRGEALLYQRVYQMMVEVVGEAQAYSLQPAASSPEALNRKVCRFAFQSLGSPLWGSDARLLLRFLHRVRALMRQTLSVCFITLPKSVHPPSVLIGAAHAADFVFDMESFVGGNIDVSAYEQKEFSGWLTVEKLPKLNSLVSVVPDNMKWAFKMRRRKMTIERFHLPPEESRAIDENRPKYDPAAGPKSSSSSSSSSSTAAAAAGGAAAGPRVTISKKDLDF